MATGIIIGVIIAICLLAVRSYMRRLAHGCCGTGGGNEEKHAVTGDLSAYAHKYTVGISGMSCKNCSARIENTFNRQDGVRARIDLKENRGEIFSESELTEFFIRQIIVGLGYSVDSIAEESVENGMRL